jgi:hypothetical protein
MPFECRSLRLVETGVFRVVNFFRGIADDFRRIVTSILPIVRPFVLGAQNADYAILVGGSRYELVEIRDRIDLSRYCHQRLFVCVEGSLLISNAVSIQARNLNAKLRPLCII